MKKADNHATLRLILAAAALAFPAISSAYVGPGAGLTMVGALWAVILAVVFVIGGILLWPLRALLNKRKGRQENAAAGDSAESQQKESAE